MQFIDVLNVIIPTLVIILIGYLFGKLTKIDFRPVADIALYVGAPTLIFFSLLNSPIVWAEAAKIWFAALIIIATCGITAYLIFTLLRQKHTGLYLPISIMNTVNLPFPIVYIAYGFTGLIAAALFSIPPTLILFSFGIYLVAGKRWQENIKEMFKIPVLYAAVLGLAFNFFDIEIPASVFNALDLLAKMAIPLVLLVLGYNVSRIKITSLATTLLATFLRVGVGITVGFLVVEWLEISGVYRAVVILESAMPAAAMSAVVTTKFKSEEDLVSSVVLSSTIISIIIIPFLLYILA